MMIFPWAEAARKTPASAATSTGSRRSTSELVRCSFTPAANGFSAQRAISDIAVGVSGLTPMKALRRSGWLRARSTVKSLAARIRSGASGRAGTIIGLSAR
ncbi:hypothetical protein D3C87_1454190 [compost metagenome]